MSLDTRRSTALGEAREQFRMQRHQEFLSTALRIVTSEGMSALTMQRLANDLNCAVGSIYRYFPSKTALMAELQRECLDVLHESHLLLQARLDELVAERGLAGPTAALVRVVAAARFWVAAEDVFPREIEMSRRLFTDQEIRFADEDGSRVLPAALRALDVPIRLLDDAVSTGALEEGSNADRAITILASTTGVLMLTALDRWDESLFQGRRMALDMIRALFVGWGAPPGSLEAAEELVAELAEHGRLVPPVAHPAVEGT